MPRKQHPAERADQSGSLLDRDGLIDSDELATFLGLEVTTLDQWASRGGGPAFHKVGKYRKYLPADVRSWLRERRHGAGQQPAA
jgi:hypothetical protein